jgi:acyl dehydratase
VPLEVFRLPAVSLEEVRATLDSEVGVSPWRTVTQAMIDKFADATDDHQFIHVDAERAAAETAFGGTIAHGFLTLSLLSAMAYETLRPLHHLEMGVNQGFEKLRFVTPVRSGSRIRARFVLRNISARPTGWIQFTYDVTVEIENVAKPALTLTWLTLSKVDPEKTGL